VNTDEKGKELLSSLREYISKCNREREQKDKREKPPIPNVCGYCRYMMIGKEELAKLLLGEEELADRITTVLEDAVINSDPSAGTLSHCVELLESLRGNASGEGGGLTVIFPHADGEEDDAT